ncbi:hypothetical protein AKJ09_09969 [Labilithrix luteola]|uniref:Tryptophan synthase alpha chain n=1 Tax=Labilithrix luteola TaxID=1391654 RepID=A0A0K1QC02_9BACT|nr:hypothetical protein [Labilithrix luteola]AKV03306.1 hypothetical protein AKJ09_09969 [Labilithrix luteola]
MRFRILGATLALALVCAVASSCSSPESLGAGLEPPLGFVSADASTDGDATDTNEAGRTLTSYCPSNQCPKGRTNCPTSRFPCDVDLLTDTNNCGACGVVCPSNGNGATYDCVNGKCALTCQTSSYVGDCDGIVDNGCETSLLTNDNCVTCGRKCDPAKPCVDRAFNDVDCGCHDDQTYCPDAPYLKCIDTRADDTNCGACGNVCDPTAGGAPSYPNAYYGCEKSACGALKCVPYTGDCDNAVTNGCETSLLTKTNCGGCGLACPSGQECRLNEFQQPTCMCPEGETFCGTCITPELCIGRCYDLTSEKSACGACGNPCTFDGNHGAGACVYGVCKLRCYQGWADCNGNSGDNCEVNIDADPENCGGCGIVCDAVAGQACVGGRCVVEPCDEVDAGGGPR